jgi:hypothetical protein
VARVAFVVWLVVLGACFAGGETASPPSEQTAELGERFALPHAQTVAVADLHVSFATVTTDSRCPRKVVCVWAGDAAIVLEVKHGAETRSVELHTTPPQTTGEAFGHRIELVSLDPYPDEPSERKPNAYVAHLVVDGEEREKL